MIVSFVLCLFVEEHPYSWADVIIVLTVFYRPEKSSEKAKGYDQADDNEKKYDFHILRLSQFWHKLDSCKSCFYDLYQTTRVTFVIVWSGAVTMDEKTV
jgi:hypothetical protein